MTSGVMPRRGDVWEVTGQRRRSVLVVSHGMYNDQPIGRSAKAVFERRVRVWSTVKW
jgi:hypothetical protein